MTDFNMPEDGAHDEAAQSQSIMTQLSGGSGGGDDFDVATASAPKKTLPLQAMAVGLVLIVAAGALFLMRREGTKVGIEWDSAPLVIVPPETKGQKLENEDEILAALAETGPPDQIPAENIKNDPFILVDGQTETRAAGPVTDPSKAAIERRRVEIQAAVGRVHVQSIILGRVPIAKINGKLLRVGDVVEEFLRITRIEDRTVFLTVDGQVFEVTMAN
ncbi:MAG: hypothetical protein ACF8R7_18925 [Phycisphaerales bacterium JB039]